MYGGSSKLGRGGGPKRLHSSFPPPPPHRGSAPPGGNRLSIGGASGGPRGRNPNRATPTDPPAVEETFSLVSGNNPLAFAMIIRLAPDLVEEIKRVEAQGGRARMKFDSNPNNPSGNIIDVGGKEFRFTWSREFGDLCDIYEERRSGEDGNGLLAESGSAWRKLNVQRILDESTKNHVKMRSEEAERKNKSRKAIVLEPGNPSMKSQIKALAAVEATPWKNYNKKKEAALKKRKVETLQVGGPPKSTHKSGLSSSTTTKGRHSSSPLPSPPDQSAAPSSPVGVVNTSKSLDDVVPSQIMGKQNTTVGTEKEIATRTNSAVRDTPGNKGNNGAKSMDLQSMLISLLMDKSSGMTIRALEKAVGDTIPNSSKKIEPIIKKIATFQAPGRYILKPGVDLESFKRPLSESGSSPEDNHRQISACEEFQDQTPVPRGGFKERVPNDNLEEQVQLNSKVGEESNALEKIDVHHTSNVFDDKKGSDYSEGQAGSSSDSGSDSDSESDSSGSGSDSGSHSRSRSRSPAGTGSGSSSESESDASSNSKEASDEDVDIMTSDDEKESKLKTEVSDQRVSSLIPVKSPDGRSMLNEIDEKQDGNESDVVEIEKDLPEEQGAEIAPTTTGISNKGGRAAEETKHYYPDYVDLQERHNYIGSLFDERENAVKDSSRHELSDSPERLANGKHKRGSDVKNLDEKSERTKKLKAENFAQAPGFAGMDVQMAGSSKSLSPIGPTEGTFKGPTIQAINRADRQGNLNVGLQKGYNQSFSAKSTSEFQRTFDETSLGKPSDPFEKSDRHGESLGRSRKHSEKGFHVREGPPMKDKSYREAQNEDIHSTEKKVPRNSREGSNGSKQLASLDSNYQKLSEMSGKLKEGRQGTYSHMGTSPRDNNIISSEKSPVINGKGITLQRELSDLELGELRESTPDETHVTKQFERKNSFKHSENKAGTSEDKNSDATRVKPSLKATFASGKPSPAFVSSGFPSNLESTNKKKNADDHFEDSTRSHIKALLSHPQHLKDHMEVGSQINKLPEVNSRSRNNEAGVSQGNDLEGHRESNRRGPANALKQHDPKRGTFSQSMKQGRRQTSNPLEEMADGGKDSVLADRNNSDQKRRESSSDENSCSYSKYEKDEPELKGPIRTFSQYKEYVQEYRDKYDSYCSLNKILEGYRNEFLKLGKDLEYAEGRDMDRYYNLLGQLKESYQRCGERHKKLKKIFVVLHRELEQLKQRIKDFAHSYNKE